MVCHRKIHGRSWVKLATKGDPDWRTAWFYHYNYEKQFPYTPNVRGVRTDDWKFIHYPHGDGKPDLAVANFIASSLTMALAVHAAQITFYEGEDYRGRACC